MNIYTLTPDIEVGNNVSYTITLNPDDEILKAHFPGQPIVPGAVLVQMAVDAISNHMKRRVKVECVGKVKFLKPITPDVRRLSINLHIEDGKSTAVIANADAKFAVLLINFK